MSILAPPDSRYRQRGWSATYLYALDVALLACCRATGPHNHTVTPPQLHRSFSCRRWHPTVKCGDCVVVGKGLFVQ